jgi:very-short-patch-repair endonuclease
MKAVWNGTTLAESDRTIEIDGPIHDTQIDDDREREYILTGRGLTFLRFTNDQVLNDLPNVLAQIRAVAR